MATQAQVKAFIDTLGPIAVKVCKERGYGNAQVWTCICQAACETGWGTSSLMTKANAFFGIKAFSGWQGKVYNAATSECYDGKTYTNITACFRAYDSLEDSVKDYFDLLEWERYSECLKKTTVKDCITVIKNGGYATSPSYINTICSIYESYKSWIEAWKVLRAESIKAGNAVKILPGAKYFSGKSIPEYIREKTWYVKYVGGGNVCLGWSTDSKYNLFAEIPIKYLETVSDPNKIVAGVGVRILPGATYPSGKEIPLEIRKKWWYVKYVANGKACLDWSVDGTLRLFTEIPIKYLERYPE